MPIQITNATIASAKGKAKPGAAQEEILDSRAEGLRLRIGARGVRWQIRMRHAGASIRLDLGDVDEWGIAEARAVAIDAKRLSRSGTLPDDTWVDRQRVTAGKKEAPAPVVQPGLWTWTEAKNEYLAEVARTKSDATLRDYRRQLSVGELDRFEGRGVAGITLEEMSVAVEAIHRRGVERDAEHVASVVRPFWTFLGSPTKRTLSGVVLGTMRELQAPQRTRLLDGTEKRKDLYIPPMLEVGRIVAIARSGAMHPLTAAAVELICFTCQRVAQTLPALRERFDEKDGLWSIPAPHRKTAMKRGDLADHVLPLPAPAWRAVAKAVEWAEAEGDDRIANSRRVFPQLRARRKTNKLNDLSKMSDSTVSHSFSYMPGVAATPHDLRRSFGTYGQEDLGFTDAELKMVLDHLEGRKSGDVTATSYNLQHRIGPKTVILEAWAEHVEKHVELAKAADPRLLDVPWLTRQIQINQDIEKNMKPRHPTLRGGNASRLPNGID